MLAGLGERSRLDRRFRTLGLFPMISGGFDPGANTVDGSEIPRPTIERM